MYFRVQPTVAVFTRGQWLITVFLLIACRPPAEELPRGDCRLVFYNVENLFDTADDPLTDDDEFLPGGMKGWNADRYLLKLQRIFQVLVNVGQGRWPDLIGLGEIENKKVLEDLLNRTPMQLGGYGILHADSPDARGIDLGFLYREAVFQPDHFEAIRIRFPFDTTTATRDVYYIQGRLADAGELHLFLCHFPSRRGGQAASEIRRMYVAQQVRERVDSILTADPGAAIVVTGDFNDEPADRSIREVLGAGGDWEDTSDIFYNYMYGLKYKEGRGTYKYGGYWNMLDQILVTHGLRDGEGNIKVYPVSAGIFAPDWLTTEDRQAPGGQPFRTYLGPRYLGGFSDHFPVWLDLQVQNDLRSRRPAEKRSIPGTRR